MRILILGAGKMGSFFTDVLSFQHETAVFDVDPKRLRFVYNTYRYTCLLYTSPSPRDAHESRMPSSA